MIDRKEALSLLEATNPGLGLIQHGLASEAVMRALARHFGEDEELWGICGLLHDYDFPATVNDMPRHGLLTAEQLEGKLPPEALHAIRAHNAEMNGSEVNCRFDLALLAGETVTGLVMAAALVRPTGIEGMQASSLKKKMKDKAFAAGVNRDNIRRCSEMGLELDAFLTLSIQALTPIAAELGLVK